ncbi:bifunctional phosphopantothenoylcysteine decarboxylase/phosphopantothenate--cysteine ligase CoaBC [Desulfuromonas thiophila]|uniref:bifunctional phosphopantothenoylcysteine decarboxylase/phosphopantothenate--cysteine ligase CoaBC n=1 Tax=Desulfuromonas thiophila TaxID=57664 RepID=UPI0024A80592|nr:bifunctional phosphopantothenoylcysteine decarboxylase/phosphopantothenate--cysteine ligase CoaBC [Desulfuromonas thiophila]
MSEAVAPVDQPLAGKRIVLGVCGGIAVYKSVELLRLLTKAGATVDVVMTRNAQEFVTPLTFQTLSGRPVHTELFNLYQEQEIGHISLADRADLFVVVPATANLIGKVAGGIADDLLSTALMATRSPVLYAPAMNVNMYENQVVQDNLARLCQRGATLVEPVCGSLACGWEGKGKLAPVEEIFERALWLLTPQDLAGEHLLVTAGPTRERIDPVRYLSNDSSGLMGYALARAARQRGAQVTLVSGPTALPAPLGVNLRRVESAAQMLDAVLATLPAATLVIKAAAVADYRPCQMAAQKLKKQQMAAPSLALEKTPDILSQIAACKGDRLVVGFAAETERLLEHARDKLERKGLDLIVANDVTQAGAGFECATNIVQILHADGRCEALPCLTKWAVAHALLDRLVALRCQRAVDSQP